MATIRPDSISITTTPTQNGIGRSPNVLPPRSPAQQQVPEENKERARKAVAEQEAAMRRRQVELEQEERIREATRRRVCYRSTWSFALK